MPYAASILPNLPDSERNVILYIFQRQRMDMGSIPD